MCGVNELESIGVVIDQCRCRGGGHDAKLISLTCRCGGLHDREVFIVRDGCVRCECAELKAIAARQGVTIREIVGSYLEDYVKEHR